MNECTKVFDRRLGVICCGHVFRRERPVQLVDRQGKYWQFLCGGIDHADRKDVYHVSVGVLFDVDPSLWSARSNPYRCRAMAGCDNRQYNRGLGSSGWWFW